MCCLLQPLLCRCCCVVAPGQQGTSLQGCSTPGCSCGGERKINDKSIMSLHREHNSMTHTHGTAVLLLKLRCHTITKSLSTWLHTTTSGSPGDSPLILAQKPPPHLGTHLVLHPLPPGPQQLLLPQARQHHSSVCSCSCPQHTALTPGQQAPPGQAGPVVPPCERPGGQGRQGARLLVALAHGTQHTPRSDVPAGLPLVPERERETGHAQKLRVSDGRRLR